jgi:2-polyprenyl-3-methyl-5-hydroxy-6-metoxy-1,4-benzoquinol methylase
MINDIEILEEIKKICYINTDIRAAWLGVDLPKTDNIQYKALANWALEHWKMYEGFIDDIDKNKNYYILDLACGAGYNTLQLSKNFPNSFLVGIDLDIDCLDFARKYNQNNKIDFLQSNVLNYFTIEQFDLIFFLETLEHIKSESHYLAIDNLLKCLKKDGKLFLTTPNENLADAGSHHIGFLNNNRFEKFKEKYKDNIEYISYYRREWLNTSEKYKLEINTGCHYRIIMHK